MKRSNANNMPNIRSFALLLFLVPMLTSCIFMQNGDAYAVSDGVYRPGVYLASAQGNIGPLTVEATFSADAITDIRIVSHEETGVLSAPAIKRIPNAIIDGQTLAVDTLAGATYTSEAILEAVKACVVQAGGDLSLLSMPADENETGHMVTLNADVAVVGAGISGMCAAVSAAQEGARVIVLEKLSYVGGSATSSLGSFLICPLDERASKYQFNIITMDEAIKGWKEYTSLGRVAGMYPDYGRLEDMLYSTASTIEWLSKLGAEFSDPSHSEGGTFRLKVDAPGMSEERHATKLISLLSQKAAELDVIILTDITATNLIDSGGAITGVLGESATRSYTINADATILACGGFSSAPEMVSAFVPDIERAGYYNQGVSTNTGDGIRMAQAVGAALFEDNWILPSYISPSAKLLEHNSRFLSLMEKNGLPEPYSHYDRLMIDKDGKRFMNEAASYPEQNSTMVNNAAYPYYALYDKASDALQNLLESGLETGDVIKGETIEELALNAGMDTATLIKTVERYSNLANSGKDTDFGKLASRMMPIAFDGPYYLVRFVNCFTGTLGGVKTDDDFRVLHKDGSVIRGLYAVGEMANRLYFDRMYMSGASLSFGSTMGIHAGKSAARDNSRILDTGGH